MTTACHLDVGRRRGCSWCACEQTKRVDTVIIFRSCRSDSPGPTQRLEPGMRWRGEWRSGAAVIIDLTEVERDSLHGVAAQGFVNGTALAEAWFFLRPRLTGHPGSSVPASPPNC